MTTPSKRAEQALAPFLEWIASEKADLSVIYEQIARAERRIVAAIGKRVADRQAVRRVRRQPDIVSIVSWTPERKARLVQVCRENPTAHHNAIARIMDLPPRAVAMAIYKHVPEEFRPRPPKAGAGSGAGRTAHHPVAQAGPLPARS